MLTQIRHIQKGTLIVVTIIIVIAFAFLYSDFDFVQGTVGAPDCVVKVYGRCYRQKEAQKNGPRGFAPWPIFFLARCDQSCLRGFSLSAARQRPGCGPNGRPGFG